MPSREVLIFRAISAWREFHAFKAMLQRGSLQQERRARRDERRAKQRIANTGRAAKMHTARLAAGPSSTTRELPASSNYYVGCSGWFYWHWRGIFYPDGLPTSRWFNYYGEHFNTVELNAPFYSWPTVKTVTTWKKQTPRGKFLYTVKVCELITHVKKFKSTKTLVRDFGFIADLLAERMGCFLFQLPPSYRYTPSRLKNILEQLDSQRRNVVEFRHASWWDEKVFSAFRKAGAIFCSCSGPRLPDALIKTADDIYVRFHGVKQWYRHNYSKEELSAWAHKIRESGAKNVYAYFNNDRDGHAIQNAKSLLRLLRKRTTTPPRLL